MISHTTAIFILGTLSAIFGVDTYFVARNNHSSISETTTTYTQLHPVIKSIILVAIGVLIGHLFTSMTYFNC